MIIVLVRGFRPRLLLLALVVVLQLILNAVTVAVAMALGVKEITVAALPAGVPVYVLASPLANLLRPGQKRQTRVRRTLRELKLGINRVSAMGTGLTVVAYIYLTVFTRLDPWVEVMVMGVGMPILQAICMTLLAQAMGQQERRIRVDTERKLSFAPPSPNGKATRVKPAGQQQQHTQQGHAAKPNDFTSQVSLLMVLCAETVYSSGAFATLLLTGNNSTFFIALAAMVAIEVVQVAVHVKLRRVMSHVVDHNVATALLGDNDCIREWLLHQELGEKVGAVLAIAFLAIDHALVIREPAAQSLDGAEFARRGAAVLLMELVGDFGKDLTSQALGIMPSSRAESYRVRLPPIALGFALPLCLIAACLVQIGLALGTTIVF